MITIYSYLFDSLGRIVERIEFLRPYTLYHYADVGGPLREGLNWSHIGVLMGFTVVLLGLAVWAFERRDLAARG